MYTINFPAIAPSAAHNFSVKTIEFKMAAVSVKRSIEIPEELAVEMTIGSNSRSSDRVQKKMENYAEIFGNIMRKKVRIMRKRHQIMRKFLKLI